MSGPDFGVGAISAELEFGPFQTFVGSDRILGTQLIDKSVQLIESHGHN